MTRGNQRDLARAKNEKKDAVSVKCLLTNMARDHKMLRTFVFESNHMTTLGRIQVYVQAALKGQRQDCADLTPLQRREK
jgi:hypothetical protein